MWGNLLPMGERKKELVFVTMMSELGAGTRGASLGFEALEIAAINKRISLFRDVPTTHLPTPNKLLYKEVVTPWAVRVEGVKLALKDLMNEVSNQLSIGHFPYVISGDHSNAAGTIAGIKKAYPDKRLGVVWVDAHGDLHTPYTSPSGNVHGMPLAISLGTNNEANSKNEPNAHTRELWEDLKNLGGISPKINSEDLVFFAVRDTEEPEDNLMKTEGIRNYTVEEIRDSGLNSCLRQAEERLSNCDILYVSFDVDSMDCDLVSRGTGTPVPNGLTPQEAENIVNYFLKLDKTVAVEMVEINPLLDNKGNKMAETALDVLVSNVRTINGSLA